MRAVPRSALMSVDRMRTVVVLPAPLGPSMAKMVPAGTSKSIPSSTTVPPNALPSPVTDSAAGAGDCMLGSMTDMLQP